MTKDIRKGSKPSWRLAIVGLALIIWSIAATVVAIHAREARLNAEADAASWRAAAQAPRAPVAQVEEGRCRESGQRAGELAGEAGHPDALDGRLADELRLMAVTAVAEMERTIRLAGLDPGVVAPASPLVLAEGGPYVAPGRGRGDGGGVAASLAALHVHVHRWRELSRVIGSLPLAPPLREYRLASPFGPRIDPILHRPAVHEGIDLVAPLGTPVLATAPGKVIFAGRKPGFGRVVEIDHGHGIHTVYGHLRNILVHTGQHVRQGSRVGRLGNSGRSTGPHLHYEIRVDDVPRDPAQFIHTGRLIAAHRPRTHRHPGHLLHRGALACPGKRT